MREKRHKEKVMITRIEYLYQKYYRRLYLYALTFVEDEEEAKDVVNDTFEMLWRNWQQEGYDELSVSTYLYKYVRSRSLDLLRHRQVEERYFQVSAATDAIHNDEEVAEFEGRITRLREAVEELPEPGHTILKCCYFKKLTYKQTAAELQITESAVHKNMVKMFSILRKMLKNTD